MLWVLRIVGMLFIIFGIYSVANVQTIQLLNYFTHLAEITATAKWYWIWIWIISLFSFCVVPIIAGIIMIRFAEKFR